MQIIMPTLLFIGITNVLGIQILVPIGKENVVLFSEIAGAVTDSPERVGKIHRQNEAHESPNWRTSGGVIEAALDFD